MRTQFGRSLFLFLSISLTSSTALAGPVTGRIVDPSGRPVPNAGVLLVGGNTIVAVRTADANGAFTIVTPDDGRYEVRVAVTGFRAQPVFITADPALQDIGAIALQVSAVSESVVVSASQVEVPLSDTSSSVTVITRAELEAKQLETVADALRTMPGLTVVETGGRGAVTTVFPRGGESDYSLVYVDDVQANAFGGFFDFAHLPVTNVERIEVVRGPQSALFGSNAIGAVVRIVTRQGRGAAAEGLLEGGSFGTTRVSAAAAGSRGPWHLTGSAERTASDGMNDRRTAAGERIVNDDYERRTGGLAAGWRGRRGAAVRAQLNYGRDERGFPGPFGSNPAGFFSGIDAISRGVNERWLGAVSGTLLHGDRARMQVQFTRGLIESVNRDSFGTSTSSSGRSTLRVQSDVTFAPSVAASVGLELQRERARSTLITAGDAGQVPVKRQVLGVFGEARWNGASRLFVTAGVRADDVHRNALAANANGYVPRPAFDGESIVSVNPKISAAWFLRTQADSFTKVRAAAGTGIRPPDAFEIAFSDNPSLKPERSRSYEAGVDQAFVDGRVLVEATAFSNRFDDLIVAVGSFLQSSRYTTDNISNARARGLELAGTASPVRRGGLSLNIRVTYTWLATEILAVDRSSTAPPPFVVGDPLLRRPRHQMSAELVGGAGPVTGYLRGGARSRTLDVEPSLGTFGGLFSAPGFSVWHAGAAWRPTRAFEIIGRVDNLFDGAYEEALGYPALGRAVMVGVRVAARR